MVQQPGRFPSRKRTTIATIDPKSQLCDSRSFLVALVFLSPLGMCSVVDVPIDNVSSDLASAGLITERAAGVTTVEDH